MDNQEILIIIGAAILSYGIVLAVVFEVWNKKKD